MKIAVSATGKDRSSLMDSRFGRCAFFALFDIEGQKWEFMPNPGALEKSGAGIKAAQFLVEQNVDAVLTGEVGPKALNVIQSAGIKAYSIPEVTVDEAFNLYQQGEFIPVSDASNEAESADISPEVGEEATGFSSAARIAVATDGTDVAQHFGRCQAYTLVEVKNGTEAEKQVIQSPGHQPGFLPRFLGEKGVDCVIAGGMGPRAQKLFAEQGIKTIIGVTGPVDEVVASYISGSLVPGESLCSHGRHGHGHNCE